MVVGYQIGEQGGNHRTWLKIVQTADAQGRIVLQTNLAYVECATGLNFKDPTTGKWLPSREEIDGYSGGAIAQYGQHKVIFANNLNTAGAIDLQMSNGQELQSEVLGLAYYDPASAQSVLIAQVQDSQGQIVGSNQVVYPNAFQGVNGNVRYTYTRAGLEQDVVLLAQPPLPESFSMSSTSCVLQVLTEFTAAPTPVIRTLPGATNDVLTDETLDFEAMTMVPGRAFLLGTNSPAAQISKHWLNVGGRTVLVESVPLAPIKSSLSQLPAFAATSLNPAAGSVQYVVSGQRLLPPPRSTASGGTEMKLASSSSLARGFVLDAITVLTSHDPYTFQGDETYLVVGPTYFYSKVTFCGGSVIKYAPNTSLIISDPGQMVCEGTAYQPTIFTAKDDDTVGSVIGDSTGQPSGPNYANPAITAYVGTGPLNFHDFRITYAQEAIYYSGALNATVSDGQIVHGATVFCTPGNGGVDTFNNVLFSGTGPAFMIDYGTINAYNCTFDQNGTHRRFLAPVGAPNWQQHLNLFNCIVANVNYYTYHTPLITGDHNGFYNSGADSVSDYGGTTFGTSPIEVSEPPFQSAAGGNYYLATTSSGGDASGFRGQGTTTGIDPQLLTDLATKTTWPPQVYNGQNISSDNFTAQVPRDIGNPGPDLGWHYAPLDYVFQNCTVSSSMTFPAAAAVGWQGQGLSFLGGYTITFNGLVANPCYFVRCNTVQESDQSGDGTGIAGSGQGQNVIATFTRFSAAGNIAPFFDANSLFPFLYNCEFWSGLVGGSVNGGLELNCYNCLFDRTAIDFLNLSSFASLTLQSCTVRGGSLKIDPGSFDGFVRDCAFDNADLSGVDSSYTGVGYNDAYISGADYLPGSDPVVNPYSDVFVSGSFNWQAGPLGDFYLPNDSLLISAGDQPASWIGVETGNGNSAALDHFTVRADQAPDTTPDVAIGYHHATLVPSTVNQQLCPNETVDLNQYNSNPDVFGSPLIYSIVTSPTHGSLSGAPADFVYTPAPNYAGQDSFSYQISDGLLNSLPAMVTIQFRSAAYDQTVLTIQGSPALITLSGQCGGSDVFSLVNDAAHGSAQVVGTGPSCVYTPNADFAGLDSFTFTVIGASAPATVTVGVLGPPEFNASCRQDKIVLNWDIPDWLAAMSVVNNFEIKRSTSPAGPYTTIATPDSNSRQFIDSTITPGVTYYYTLSFTFYDRDELKDSLSSDVVISSCPVGQWGPTDVAFIVDNTGSMINAITTVQDGIESVLDDIVASSGGDYRLALVTPDNDQVDVRVNFAEGNRTDFETELALLNPNPGDGNNTPESTDECLNTVVNHLSADGRPQQIGDFTPAFRSGVRRLVVLITDAPPGGFDDPNPYDPTVDPVRAHSYAVDAAADGIKINAILVGLYGDAVPVMQDYAQTTCGWYSSISGTGDGTMEAIREMLYSAGGCSGPQIVTQPQSQDTVVGATVTFTVAATGTGTLHYQWIHNNNTAGLGSSLTLNNVQLSDAGTYYVIVSDDEGSVMSDPVTLTVQADPTITVQPANKTAVTGGSVSFSVVAVGNSTLSYQWYHDSNPVGSGGATLTLNNVVSADAGDYFVHVSDTAGSLNSQHATLTVLNLSQITGMELDLSSDIVPPGSTVSYSGKVTTTGGQQWLIENPSVSISTLGASYGPTPTVGNGTIVFPILSKEKWTYVPGDVDGKFAYTDPGDPNFGKECGGAYQLTMTIPGCPLTAHATVVALPSGTAVFTAATKSYTDQLGQKLTLLESAANLKDRAQFGPLLAQLDALGQQPYFDAGELQLNQVDLPVDGMPVSVDDMVNAGLGNYGDGAALSSTLDSMTSQLTQLVDRIKQIDPANLTQSDADDITAMVSAYGSLSQQLDALNPSAVGVKEATAELNSLLSGAIPEALDALRAKSAALADAASVQDLGLSDWWRALTQIFSAATDLDGWLRANQIKGGIILANSLANIMLANLINSLAPSGLDSFDIYASAASGMVCPLWNGLPGSRLEAMQGFCPNPQRNVIVLVGCMNPDVFTAILGLSSALAKTPNLAVCTKLKILIEIIKLGRAGYEWNKSVSEVPPYWLSNGFFAVGFPERYELGIIEGHDLVSPEGWPDVAQGAFGCEGTVIVVNIQDLLFHAENAWFLPNCP